MMGADIEPYDGVERLRDAVDLRRLKRMLPLPGKVLRASLIEAGKRGRYHAVFRHCRQCTSLGQHSVTYQMLSEGRCPAHGQKLETRCQHLRAGDTLLTQRKPCRPAVSLCAMRWIQLRKRRDVFGSLGKTGYRRSRRSAA